MTGQGPAQEAIGIAAVRQVATLMAAAAITAPKSGGQLFLAGKPAFLETVIIDDPATRARLAGWLRARGKERREAIWFRDADVAEAVDAVLFIGLAPNWYPPNYDCGACGYATCAEFLHASKELRKESDELEFTGPTCNLRDIDLGIAVGSAARTASLHTIDCRCQTRVAAATSPQRSPLRCRCRSPTRRSGSTAACPRSTSTPSTCPLPGHCPSGSRAPSAPADPATVNTPATPLCADDRHSPSTSAVSPGPRRRPHRRDRSRTTTMTFSTLHITLTALISGLLFVLAAAAWRLPRGQWQGVLAVAVLSAGAAFLWRMSANMPQLNDDGLNGFSANDWAAPVLTYVVLSVYGDLRPPSDPARYRQTRALAALIALVINVVTI